MFSLYHQPFPITIAFLHNLPQNLVLLTLGIQRWTCLFQEVTEVNVDIFISYGSILKVISNAMQEADMSFEHHMVR